MPPHSAIQWSPPHTRPWRPRHQSRCIDQIDVCDRRVYLQHLGQGLEAATGQGWRLVRGPFGQHLISEMLKNAQKKGHSTETCRICLIQNLEKQSRNPVSCSIYVQSHTAGLGVFDNSTRSKMNDETTVTTAPANHPNLSLSQDVREHDIFHQIAAAFSDSAEPTTHQALAPSAPIWLSSKLMFVTDPFIFSASAKAWRQRQIKVGVLLEGPSGKT